jgi:hypothetical protein
MPVMLGIQDNHKTFILIVVCFFAKFYLIGNIAFIPYLLRRPNLNARPCKASDAL